MSGFMPRLRAHVACEWRRSGGRRAGDAGHLGEVADELLQAGLCQGLVGAGVAVAAGR